VSGMVMPKQGDIDLLATLIDMRDSAHLAGHREKPMTWVAFNGGRSMVATAGGRSVDEATFNMQRLLDLGLLRVITRKGSIVTFDLVDDVRDRLEEMRAAAGQPSRTAQAEGARLQAEAALWDLEERVDAAARQRAARRAEFASRVGRTVRLLAAAALVVAYVVTVTIAGYFLSANLPVAFVVGIVIVAVGLTVLDWAAHVDGFAIAKAAGEATAGRVRRWLETFDVPA